MLNTKMSRVVDILVFILFCWVDYFCLTIDDRPNLKSRVAWFCIYFYSEDDIEFSFL